MKKIQPVQQLRATGSFLIFVSRNFMNNQGMEVAKSLTYTSLFAVVPLLMLVFSMLSAFPSFQVFGEQVQGMIYDRLLPSTESDLEAYLTRFASQARNLTWAGAVILLVTAYLMLVNIERNFNRIWGVGEQRKGVTSFLVYWSVLSLGPLLLGAGFAISSYFTSLALFERFTEITQFAGGRAFILGIFPVFLTTTAFTLLYVAVPNCQVKLRHGVCGALVVALLFVVVKWIFKRFITGTSYELVYGTFAAIPIFLMWLYVCWVVILFGANLVRAIPLFGSNTGGEAVHPAVLMLALLHKFWDKQQQGDVLKVSELLEEKWPFRQVSPDKLLSQLEKKKLILSLGDDEYVLSRDLESVSFWDVLSETPWGLPSGQVLQSSLPVVLTPHLPEEKELLGKFTELNSLAARHFGATIGEYFRRYSPAAVEGD